jgi:hypothetical protein
MKPTYTIRRIEAGPATDFTHEVSLDEVFAHEDEDRADAFVERLAREGKIERVVREDRESVLCRAPHVSQVELELLVARAWEETGPAR